MKLGSFDKTKIVKGDRFFKGQYPHNDIERDLMTFGLLRQIPKSMALQRKGQDHKRHFMLIGEKNLKTN